MKRPAVKRAGSSKPKTRPKRESITRKGEYYERSLERRPCMSCSFQGLPFIDGHSEADLFAEEGEGIDALRSALDSLWHGRALCSPVAAWLYRALFAYAVRKGKIDLEFELGLKPAGGRSHFQRELESRKREALLARMAAEIVMARGRGRIMSANEAAGAVARKGFSARTLRTRYLKYREWAAHLEKDKDSRDTYASWPSGNEARFKPANPEEMIEDDVGYLVDQMPWMRGEPDPLG